MAVAGRMLAKGARGGSRGLSAGRPLITEEVFPDPEEQSDAPDRTGSVAFTNFRGPTEFSRKS
jgi:hypothetical protein